jgi:hypothetical protein
MKDDPRQWIASVCRDERERVKANRTVVAAKVNRSEDVIRRFETLRGQWSPHTPEIVAAYAELAGVEPIELWQRAIDSWKASQLQAQPVQPPRTEERKSAGTHRRDTIRTKVRSGSKGSLEPVDLRRQRKSK